MNIEKEKYIIVEIIPTTRSKYSGEIAQISALKIDGLNLIDRFDYRLNEDKILIPDIKKITAYDKDKFIYLNSTNELLNELFHWSENLPLVIIDNDYTNDYLSDLPNKRIPIHSILNVENTDTIVENLIEKYQLQPTNYIVDLLYESILYQKK
jgi:DNA polymerase III alpha subunit (gram-positive type)